ncbi:MAG TPA: tyrosinase family protein [Gemmataceae bacterium]|jgi:polyphenol oxidase
MSTLDTNDDTPRASSRRAFLQTGALAAGGLALAGLTSLPGAQAAGDDQCSIPAPPGDGTEKRAPAYSFPANAPPRIRKSFAELTPDEVKELTEAYRLLKKKEGDLSWCNQANIHANHCVAASYYLLIHDSWLFLPWHRSYLYFYESLLGELLGKPSFALPYWDWTAHPTIPDPFFDVSGSLFDPNRGPEKGQSIAGDPETYSYTRQDYLNQLLAYPDFFSFGGYPGDQTSNQPGDLEQFPHNLVHSWVGTQSSPFIDMGNLATAARDLLFFLHHANIDRIWAEWVQVPGHSNPSDPQWQQQWFNFFDPKTAKPVSVTIADSVNGNMNVRYQEPQTTTIAFQTGEQDLTGRSFTSRKAALPGPTVARLIRAAPAAPPLAPPALRARVRIESVRSPRQQPVRIRVFLNKPGATEATPVTDPHFAGSIPLVPSFDPKGKPAHMHPPVTLSLDVTRTVAKLIQENPENANVEVTLVPVGLDGKLSKAKVRFKDLSIKVMK